MGGWTCPRLHGFVLWLFPHTPWPQALLTPLLPLGQCQAQVGLSPLQKPSCMVLDLPLDGVSFHPQVHESVFMVVQLLEVSRDTGCITWLVIIRDKAESLQNAACSPDKSLSCSSLSGKSTQEDQAQPPQRGGTASGFHSCSIQSIAGPGATSSLSQFTSGPSPIHSRALRPPLTASPKRTAQPLLCGAQGSLRSRRMQLFQYGSVQAMQGYLIWALRNQTPVSHFCLFTQVPPCLCLSSCAPQAYNYPNPRAWLPSGPINQRYQHHSPPCRTCPSLPASPQLSDPRRHMKFAGEGR